MTIVIDGKEFARKLTETIANEVAQLKENYHITPGLAVIQMGEDPASSVYVRNKISKTKEVGMNSFEFMMPENTQQRNLITKIESLNNDPKVHGILIQLPLPAHIDEKLILNTINPAKDIDGFHVVNVGKLVTGQDGFVPCTPLGCMMLIKSIRADLTGLKAVIIGRSNIVGKPMASLLLNENCTVTIVHSRSLDLQLECQQADILVVAVGKPKFINADWIKKDAIVIDVGINRITGEDGKNKLIGDVDFTSASTVASAITPVPGGVGPMTIACLLKNTVKAALQTRQSTGFIKT